uniref:Uncharacterized protein n=1 Tax=Anguilla anguilla TaxID=7936 RepID=A0A0E9W5Z7_ANGAN
MLSMCLDVTYTRLLFAFWPLFGFQLVLCFSSHCSMENRLTSFLWPESTYITGTISIK